MRAPIRLLRASDRSAAPWRNGGGITREVCRSALSADCSAFDWRVSIAEVSQAGPFSRFSGCQRLISIIEGRGMELRFRASAAVQLRTLDVHSFDGEAEVSGALPFGPVSDLNVIYRKDAVGASLQFSRAGENWDASSTRTLIVINVEPEPIHCTSASETFTLERLDALQIPAGVALAKLAGSACALIEIIPR